MISAQEYVYLALGCLIPAAIMTYLSFLAYKGSKLRQIRHQSAAAFSAASLFGIVAVVLGLFGQNYGNNSGCQSSYYPAVTVIMGILSIVLAVSGLRLAIKNRKWPLILAASVFILLLAATACFAYFISIFCFNF